MGREHEVSAPVNRELDLRPELLVRVMGSADFDRLRDGDEASAFFPDYVLQMAGKFGPEWRRVAIFGTDDPKVMALVRKIFDAMDPIREEGLLEVMTSAVEAYRALGRLPQAWIAYYFTPSFVVCQEPTCKFHRDGGCGNDKVMIFDDDPTNQWCLEYEGKTGK